ncbi:glycine--tRNA ligase subunit beta [Sphingomonas sp. BT-65]|uniref:glycine--tRNA ligase subunit beta n=1 Tax=Sphingomonas sp. BT-65 TaxID=2989821 RepID=UPI0022358F34|nr:glycine--tRNA ligase subunit beta [Sphingomonas sp. BT-65]MCW4461773.1 glycine--tRNA ligase subunit beta [Sphingomonas sp. BT-65]
MTDFLLELRSEEIPARMQDKAREDLARLFAAELDKAGIKAAELVTYATPRRLALIARDLPAQTQAVSEETKGPRVGAPPQALEGFLRKAGLTQDQLVERDGVYFAVIDKPGRATAEVLAAAIPAIVRAFPWPKSMRWGDASLSTESLRWVRPLQGIVALFGDDVVPCEVAGVVSGAATVGHRFHHPGVITIGSTSDYVEKLRACHVVVDQAERRNIIALGAKMAANKAGLTLIEDEGLLIENAGLTEWPVPLLGRFDEAFLDVPPEVIQLTARMNQKYFVCQDAAGKLANAFVCTANIDAADGGAKIVEGNQKVLAARLSDARFFYETDLKVPLEEQAKKLEKIVFHEKLGTVADKVERVAKLARWLVEEGVVKSSPSGEVASRSDGGGAAVEHGGLRPPPLHRPSDRPPPPSGEELADLAERAARLAKADLVTGMVGEFPELQGLMGGYYAAAQGEDAAVAEAIRDHYKPVGQGDDVPTAPVTVAVSLADKIDTIGSFFKVGEKPTGSKDPFALRRAAIGALSLITENSLRFQLEKVFIKIGGEGEVVFDLFDFFLERLKVQQRAIGVRHDLIEAGFLSDQAELGRLTEVIRLLELVKALQSFVTTDDGANLLAGYKRAANILKKEGYAASDPARHPGLVPGSTAPQAAASRVEGWTPEQVRGDEGGEGPKVRSYTPEPAEAALIAALDAAEPKAAAAVESEQFEAAMAALATLRAPIDAFFTDVTVNDADPAKRESRLALLARMRDAVHRVADFGKIEG